MFDVSNAKNTLYGIELSVERKDLVSADDLITLGKTCNVAVLESAGFFQSIAGSRSLDAGATSQVPQTMFAPVNLNDFKDFKLTFFGPIGLEGKSSTVPMTNMRQDEENAPSLPWLVFGHGFDNVMTCECVCPAWTIPSKKIKLTPAQQDKEIAQNAKQQVKPAESSGKENQNPGPISNAEDDLAAFVSEAMGTKKKGKSKAAPKGKAAAKAKAKAKGKKQKGAEEFPIAFVDEPLFLFCNILLRWGDGALLDWVGNRAVVPHGIGWGLGRWCPTGLCGDWGGGALLIG